MGNQQINYTVKKLNQEIISITCSQDTLIENLKKLEPQETDLVYKLQPNNFIEIVKEDKIQEIIISLLKQEQCLKELQDQFDHVTKKIKLNEEQIHDLQIRNGENSDSIQELKNQSQKTQSQTETQSVQQD